ncbi:hypothetical protein PR048_026239 [Dryococelus australis]|uniref:Uncharacterized protein n=1 Tax=Dryococelus australis TaxID=614101 RepID=A0ABQ9GKS1_9NEOP|nr:hypothetical protein PR048_026239 [Dryococelus australis]
MRLRNIVSQRMMSLVRREPFSLDGVFCCVQCRPFKPLHYATPQIEDTVAFKTSPPRSYTTIVVYLIKTVHDKLLGATVIEQIACSPPIKANRVITTGFSHVGIVPDDAAGRRVFSGIRFPPPRSIHSGAAPYSPQSSSSALKTSIAKAGRGLQTGKRVNSRPALQWTCCVGDHDVRVAVVHQCLTDDTRWTCYGTSPAYGYPCVVGAPNSTAGLKFAEDLSQVGATSLNWGREVDPR